VSRFDYEASKLIAARDLPFYGIVMAAMRQADTENAERLRLAFPDTWDELQERYWAPGGFLPEELVDDAAVREAAGLHSPEPTIEGEPSGG